MVRRTDSEVDSRHERGGRAREKEKKEAEAEVEEEGEGKGREGGHVIINVALHCSSQPM